MRFLLPAARVALAQRPWGAVGLAPHGLHTSAIQCSPPDYYELLAPHLAGAPLADKWAVDPSALKAAWRKAQAQTHPDRMISATSEEQDQAAARSALVNRAYETLREPLPRATYLVRGGPCVLEPGADIVVR